MHYVDRFKFIKIFNQTKHNYHVRLRTVAYKCHLPLDKLQQLVSSYSQKQRINVQLVKQIGFGLGLNPSEIHYWVMRMGVQYRHATPQTKESTANSKSRTSSKDRPDEISHRKHRHRFLKNRTPSSNWSHWLITIGIIVIILIAGNSCLSIYHHHEAAEQKINRIIQKNDQSDGVYNTKSLQKPSNQTTVKRLVSSKQQQDHDFAQSMTYNSKNNVATIHLNKKTANAINYVTANHNKKRSNHVPTKEKQALKSGIKIDNCLTNQAIQIANQSHDGYFTFKFANAKPYEAPNTAASKQ